MKNKFVQIDHVYAISDKDKEPNRYNYLNQWLSSDFDQKYYTLGSYCYGDSLNEEDLKKYNISESLGRGNKSLYLNHIKIFENILELYQPGQNFLVLESDAVPVKGYAEIINDQIVALKDKDWDILDVGNGLGWTPAIEGHIHATLLSIEPADNGYEINIAGDEEGYTYTTDDIAEMGLDVEVVKFK